jgi:hypothetical protein
MNLIRGFIYGLFLMIIILLGLEVRNLRAKLKICERVSDGKESEKIQDVTDGWRRIGPIYTVKDSAGNTIGITNEKP